MSFPLVFPPLGDALGQSDGLAVLGVLWNISAVDDDLLKPLVEALSSKTLALYSRNRTHMLLAYGGHLHSAM